MSKPITLYGHATGPNPWKVAIILEELKIPYEHKLMDMGNLKKPPFEAINPNGRVPAIEDPNTGITLWESGAIIEYLADTYDKNSTLNFTQSPEKYQVKQWIHFQMSGQGPYFGQAAWFEKFHGEKIPSARERYDGQDLALEKNYPNWYSWNQRLMQRPAVKKMAQDKQKAMSAGH